MKKNQFMIELIIVIELMLQNSPHEFNKIKYQRACMKKRYYALFMQK